MSGAGGKARPWRGVPENVVGATEGTSEESVGTWRWGRAVEKVDSEWTQETRTLGTFVFAMFAENSRA